MDAKELVAAGYRQISSKYRLVARLPPGKTGLEALATYDPDLAKRMLENVNNMAAEHYSRCCPTADRLELTREEFAAFRQANNR